MKVLDHTDFRLWSAAGFGGQVNAGFAHLHKLLSGPRKAPVVHDGSENTMNEGLATYRLSILAFDTPARLWDAMAALLKKGVSSKQICLVAQSSTLNALAPPDGAEEPHSGTLQAIVEAPQVVVRFNTHGEFAARCNPQTLPQCGHSESGSTQFDWMHDELGKNLSDHAQRGAVILIVSAQGAEQHSAIATILLKHGQHRLQLHEFTWAGDSR